MCICVCFCPTNSIIIYGGKAAKNDRSNNHSKEDNIYGEAKQLKLIRNILSNNLDTFVWQPFSLLIVKMQKLIILPAKENIIWFDSLWSNQIPENQVHLCLPKTTQVQSLCRKKH